MKYENFKFIYVSLDYLKYMHSIDSEVFFVNNPEYEKKPHLGILLNQFGRKYVIPLSSAKPKHASWNDITSTTYRVYEIIDIRKTLIDPDDIVVDIRNTELLKNMAKSDSNNYKQRILSILDIKKMFPIKDNTYQLADLNIVPNLCLEERQRRILMQKEYEFCVNIKNDIIKRASNIYTKQITTGKILKYHCNYSVLEKASDQYQLNKNAPVQSTRTLSST